MYYTVGETNSLTVPQIKRWGSSPNGSCAYGTEPWPQATGRENLAMLRRLIPKIGQCLYTRQARRWGGATVGKIMQRTVKDHWKFE